MHFSYERNGLSQYEDLSFKTTIDGNNYTIEHFTEIHPHWKDSGVRGDYLYVLTVTDADNNKLAQLSSLTYNPSSFIISPENTNIINLNKLNDMCNHLEVLPISEKPKNVATQIKNIVNVLQSKGYLNHDYKDNNIVNNDENYQFTHLKKDNESLKQMTMNNKPFYHLNICDKNNTLIAELCISDTGNSYIFHLLIIKKLI